MNKLDLKINTWRTMGTLGMDYVYDALRKSDLFNVQNSDERLNVIRGERATIAICKGKKIYIDFWEYPTPTYSKNTYNYNFDLIIKLQHRPVDINLSHQYLTKKRILNVSKDELKSFCDKIVPWTFFPSRMFLPYVGNEYKLYEEKYNINKLAFFCGKGWKCRKQICKKLEQQGISIDFSDQGEIGGKVISDEEYLKQMKSCKYGLVLAGRASAVTDFKNRREADYMMLKKPLLINYKPYYYNEFKEGVHYIHIDENTDLEKIEDMYNIEEIAEAGYQWYLNNIHPDGVAKVFRQILKDKLEV